ncbi:hypothetical protein RFM42_32550 [Mesorhizobium sp. VK25D]|uniref:HTH lysR-type domain-containing protein n=1 Tax=Mesorhizobium vachelliae TaxID=3072309 RepID=A0ABU5AEN7_9HYPH|nr:LysR family transcriptional regulator [Mesorhizobium sp. VK25D]MDX8535739.1 hypothetical protein [Mesorhizobium sp. VK25D]
MNVTPGAVSRQIKAIEDELGVPLVTDWELAWSSQAPAKTFTACWPAAFRERVTECEARRSF